MATPPRADPPKHPQQHQPDPRQSQQQANQQRPAAQQASRPGSDPVSGVGPGGTRQPQHDQPQTSKTSTGDKLEEKQVNEEARARQEGGTHDPKDRDAHEARAREEREKHEAEERQRRERGDERREGQRLHARDDEEDDEGAKEREGRERFNRESHSDERPQDQDANRKEGKDDDKKPKRAILPEGQAYQLFYNGHKIARAEDKPTQWLAMGRLGDGTPVVQSPMTPDLEEKLKKGKFYLADNVSDDPPAPQAHRDPL